MEKHLKLSDEEFEFQFQSLSLDPELFSHEAHLRLAWIHLKKYGESKAISNIKNQLLAFVDHVGARAKYNDTLTVAAVKMVHHFMKRSSSSNFQEFIFEFPKMKTNFKDLIMSHYKTNIFSSEKARKEYIKPDLIPFE